jgi:hypothetical protein
LSSFSDHGIWESWKRPVRDATVDGHGSKKRDGKEVATHASFLDDTLNLSLTCPFPCNDKDRTVLTVPVVYENTYGRMYRIIAGCDVVRYIEDRLGV